MPILAPETDLYPENLFVDFPSPSDGRSWWVLHTRPRQEKSLARLLLEHQVPFFLPLVPHKNHLRGRVITSHIPLFTSYVFLLAGQQERLTALATQRVVMSLAVPNQQQLWQDLRQIRHLIESGAPITAEDRFQAERRLKSAPAH